MKERWLSSILLLIMLVIPAGCAEHSSTDVDSRIDRALQNPDEPDSTPEPSPELIPGTVLTPVTDFKYYRYIDSMDLPEYAKEFYQVLEESTDNDGIEDYLIEDQYFTAGNATTVEDLNQYEVVHSENEVTMFLAQIPEEDEKLTEGRAMCEQLRTVGDIFMLDHPEVFWLVWKKEFYVQPLETEDGIESCVFMKMKGLKDSSFDIRGNYTEQSIREDIVNINQRVENILDGIPSDSVYEKVKYFNGWLTTHNGYYAEELDDQDLRVARSALLSCMGGEGPSSDGYASAFKVLCDHVQIPCITVQSRNYNDYYFWNYVQAGQLWYGVNVGFNDPVVIGEGGKSIIAKESGYENEQYLMCGMDTSDEDGIAFKDKFFAENLVYKLPSDIELSETAYDFE